MPLRALLRYLMNNEQLIQKLAESRIIRRAAQFTASMFHKGKELGEEKIEKLRESETMNRLQNEAKHTSSKVKDFGQSVEKTGNILQAFIANLDEEWKKGKRQIEEQKIKEEEEAKRRRIRKD